MLQARIVAKLVSYWPPYLVSGITVRSAAPDMTEIVVGLQSRPWNRNYVGTHFGGSLYSMCDPFYMFMLLHQLGPEYIVWDLASEIRFVKAVKDPVTATFRVPRERAEQIRAMALAQFKVEPEFETQVVTRDGTTLVAEVKKTLYVRRKDAKARFSRT